jgi:hypothetical protein
VITTIQAQPLPSSRRRFIYIALEGLNEAADIIPVRIAPLLDSAQIPDGFQPFTELSHVTSIASVGVSGGWSLA